jgi:hypothetical protein
MIEKIVPRNNVWSGILGSAMLTTFPPGTLKGQQHYIFYLTIFLRKSAQNVPIVDKESENTHFNVQTFSEATLP